MPQLLTLPLDQVSPAAEGQVRQHFDASRLQALADSLRRSGIREPVIVRPHESTPGHYVIVAGERRWRAAQMAGLHEIPCLVDERLGERRDRLLAQAEENLQRENLNAVEEAEVLVQLMEAFGIDAGDAGALMGRSYQQARRLLQLHGAPQPVKDAIVHGLIDGRAALELVRIHNKLVHRPGPNARKRAVADVDELLDRVVNERWTIRRLEAHAKQVVHSRPRESTPVTASPPASTAGSARPPGGEPDAAMAIPLPALAPTETSPNGTPWRALKGGLLQLDTGRIVRGEFSPHEYAALVEMLEQLLMATRHAPRRPARDVSPRG
jgi:ParB/RepB/Spo0J family partition protein